MINIAICDDNIHELNQMYALTKDIMNRLSHVYSINKFLHLDELNESLASFNYDIIIIDIKFDNEETTSFDTVKRINNVFPNTQIIFVTAYPKYFFDVYEFNHTYCVLKDQINTTLNKAIIKALNNIIGDKDNVIKIKSNKTIHIIPINKICYIEKSLRKLVFYVMTDKSSKGKYQISTYETYGVFSDYYDQLPKCFIQTHRSYIVNLNYAKSIGNNRIVLFPDNKSIPLSKTYKNIVFEKAKSSSFDND